MKKKKSKKNPIVFSAIVLVTLNCWTTVAQHVISGDVQNLNLSMEITQVDVQLEKISSFPTVGYGWEANSWMFPDGYTGSSPTDKYVILNAPGPYNNSGTGGYGNFKVRFISDPYLTVGAITKHLSEWGSAITVPDGESASLAVPSQFTGTGANRFYKDGTQIGSGSTSYALTGNGSVVYKLQTRDGYVANPTYEVSFTLNFQAPATVAVTGVTVSPTSKTLNVGETQQLTATVAPSNATDKSVNWSSSNASVASVSTTGLVTANAAGSATITVKTTDGNKTATSTITVNVPTVAVTGVAVSPTSKTLDIGETQQLTATIAPTNATDKSVSWTSSNASVASVSTTGLVTANATGSATITAKTTDGNKTATSTITVNVPTVAVTGVTVSPTSKTLNIGETQQLTATVAPTNATDKSVSWTSSNASVASVNSTGLVTANASGNATITVTTTDGNKTATSTITVNVPTIAVTGVSLNKTSTSLTVGGTETLTATIAPTNATNQAVNWTSSNTGVATVSNGVITAIGVGTSTIMVTTINGSKTATCTVNVSAASVSVTGVSLDQTSLNATVGDPAVTLIATIAPSNATNQNVNWSSSNTSVATVTNGVVNFIGAGNTVITVTTTDGSKTATCNVTVNLAVVSVTGVVMDIIEKTMSPGETFQLLATVSPSNATNKNVTWASENTSIITVSSTGLVTAIGAGTANVVVTTVDGNKTDYTRFIVLSGVTSVTGITLNKSVLSLSIGTSETLIATVTPTNATNKGVVWSTSDASVVSIVNGSLTGVKEGTATITATTQDGGYAATCEVTVVSGSVPQPTEYTVTISSNAGGTVSPTGSQKVKEGENLTITITPNEGYEIEKITLDGVEVVATTSLQLTNVRANHSVVITFKYDPVANEMVEKSDLKIFSIGNGSLKIETTEMINYVKVYSLRGTVVSSVQVNETGIIIKDLPKSICIVQVSLGDGKIETQKAIVK